MCKHLNFPYSDLAKGHVLTVRNRKLWIDAIGDPLVDESLDLHTPLPGSMPRGNFYTSMIVYLPPTALNLFSDLLCKDIISVYLQQRTIRSFLQLI